VLYSFQVQGNQLEMFFSDEHPMILGVQNVVATSGAVTTFPITPMTPLTTATPGICVSGAQLNFGTTNFDSFNDLSGVDANGPASSCTPSATIGCGRPLPPVLFYTDLNTNTANPRAGDWQFNGVASLPIKVCGSWKNVSKTITTSGSPGNPTQFGINVAADPPANVNTARTGWNLGIGSDPVPVGFVLAGAWVQSYGTESAWDLDLLPLDPSHSYRFQFIVHDGDQTRIGGDVGQACIIASPACPAGYGPPGACNVCDTNPQPGDGSYVWFCFPTGSTVNPYTLLKIPTVKLSSPLYANSGGFIPTNNYTDAQGFKVSCNCRRTVLTCPRACCSTGICNFATGVCDCSAVGIAPAIDQTTCCPTGVNIPPCFNNNTFCSGHGSCVSGNCVCVTDSSGTAYSGYNCNISTPATKTCANLPNTVVDCASCNAASQATGIYCQWCTPQALSDNRSLTIGSCIAASACSLNPDPQCVLTVVYVPQPCPDQCSGHGVCANVSCKPNGNCNGKSPNATYTLVCQCYDTYSGINCGNHDTSVALGIGLGAAAIVGIVIAIVVVIAALGGGGYAIAQNMAAAPVAPAMNNPLYVGAGKGGENPLNRVG